ncbi:SMG5 [Asbolus verrucosus]|uniref:SMG5 n=1 Tax=Asbolus verrucosus TaxID=1661398 RepID=A0A482VC72_ASBVE|nr:SMG5 [Asbolus verrucosus]
MKKVKNSTDIHQKQGQELSKKLYRSTTEHAKRLDDARSCARTIGDLFTPSLQIHRRKFCEYCERLIFSDPALYGKKGEELLWRKGYYDVVSTAKKLKKKEYTQDNICNLEAHINSGIGFYHHLIAKLQSEFNLNLKHVIDFALEDNSANGDCRTECLEWANLSVHQCLIYLGDLSRYKLEIFPKSEPTLAFRYYLQAISFKADHGMPHNQMGTLAMNQNKYLDAVYHYMRCLACTVSFEGTINNLHSLFDKNSKYLEQLPLEQNSDCISQTDKNDHLKRFIARFLLLIDIWYFNKKVSKVYSLCHQTYKDLEECLSYLKTSNESCESPTETESVETDSGTSSDQLTNDMIFKVIVICLLCISKLQKLNPHQVSTAVAFTLAIYSQLVQHVTNHIQESVLNYPLPEVEVKLEHTNGIVKDLLKKNKRKRSSSKLRRRKVLAVESESDASEGEDDTNSEISSDDSFVSDSENILADSSDEEADVKKSEESAIEDNSNERNSCDNEDKIDVIKKIKRMDVNDMLEIITEESSLQSVKVINDWLMQDTEILKSCGMSTRSLLRQITNMLNLININIKNPKLTGIKLNINSVIRSEEKIPLPEDIVLKEVDILAKAHKNIDWDYLHKHGMNVKEESVTRIIKFMAFGKFLTNIEETGISFDEQQNVFVCRCEENDESKPSNAVVDDLELQDAESGSVITDKFDDKESENKGQLMKMKHMGQLWLASEVRALENRVKGKASLSPYLILDADALIKYTFMVKHFVHSRKFIVLIPSAVVSALDDLKREQSEARDAIRWLESQFHRGNRFFRAQRPQERASIPFIKYPKKKDKEMSIYIQIIECCYFLAEQQKGAANLITLLIGNQNVLSNGENKEFSYVGLAQSAGVSIESITQFYGKWKKSYKTRR